MSYACKHDITDRLGVRPRIRRLNRGRELGRRGDGEKRSAVLLYRGGLEIVIRQQAIVDIVVAVATALLWFRDGVRHCRRSHSGNECSVDVHACQV